MINNAATAKKFFEQILDKERILYIPNPDYMPGVVIMNYPDSRYPIFLDFQDNVGDNGTDTSIRMYSVLIPEIPKRKRQVINYVCHGMKYFYREAYKSGYIGMLERDLNFTCREFLDSLSLQAELNLIIDPYSTPVMYTEILKAFTRAKNVATEHALDLMSQIEKNIN